MTHSFDAWLGEVRIALNSINMPLEDWQTRWAFDFEQGHRAGTSANDAAAKANRFWWHEQNKAIRQHCHLTANCWLPRGHHGECKPL